MDNLGQILQKDGENVMRFIVDESIPKAFVSIADGATECEFTREFSNISVYLTIKKRGAKNG